MFYVLCQGLDIALFAAHFLFLPSFYPLMRRFLLNIATAFLAIGCQTATPTSNLGPQAPGTATATTPDATLRNTRWVLRQLSGQPVPAPTNAEPYVLLRQDTPNAEGNGSCNRFRGTYEQPADGQLRFGALLSTKMACASPEGNTTESGFTRALENTRTFRISGDTLRLFGEAGSTPAAVLHAVYLR
jgi:heat shock protein HslJ